MTADISALMEKIYASNQKCFIDLARIAELDPVSDFQGCDLRGCNFRNQNLIEYDFGGSILFGSDIRGAIFNERTIRSALFFDFEGGFSEKVVLAGRKFSISTSYQDRSAFLIALLSVADSNQVQPYLDFQMGRERSERVRTAIGLAQKALGDVNHRLALLEVGSFLDRTVRSGYPMARYQFREAFNTVRRLFPEASQYLPKL